MKWRIVLLLLIAGCQCATPPAMTKYRVQRVSPAGTVHGEWIVESDQFPLIDSDYKGKSFLKTCRYGEWTYTGLFAPSSWLLNVTEEK